MMRRTAQFQTDGAERYMQRLCEHFGRKVETHCQRGKGCVEFGFGRCEMRADASALEMIASSETQDQLDNVIDVITSHLERYAFRENPRLEWLSTPNTAQQEEK
ncbi:MAG: DUF2218 domain-containing protein [Pseudomonadota bacterium]